MRANILKDLIDISKLTIGEAQILKQLLGLSNSEAIAMFLGGMERENIQI